MDFEISLQRKQKPLESMIFFVILLISIPRYRHLEVFREHEAFGSFPRPSGPSLADIFGPSEWGIPTSGALLSSQKNYEVEAGGDAGGFLRI